MDCIKIRRFIMKHFYTYHPPKPKLKPLAPIHLNLIPIT